MVNVEMTFRYNLSEMTNSDLDGYYRMIDFGPDGLSRDEYTQIDFDEDVEFFTEEFGDEDIATEYVLSRIILSRIITTWYDEHGKI